MPGHFLQRLEAMDMIGVVARWWERTHDVKEGRTVHSEKLGFLVRLNPLKV